MADKLKSLVSVVLVVAVCVVGIFFLLRWEEQQDAPIAYEATLTIEGDYNTTFFCIATVHSYVDSYPDGSDEREYRRYFIDKIEMPYGKIEYPDAEFYNNESSTNLLVGTCGNVCKLRLGAKATESSYQNLEKEVISRSGGFCGDIDSNIFHFINCPQVNSINPKNLIYFSSENEARVLGYEICNDCSEHW